METLSQTGDDQEFWKQVKLVYSQFDGLMNGYADHSQPEESISYSQWLIYQALTDVWTLMEAFQIDPLTTPDDFMYRTHCSSLVKVIFNNKLKVLEFYCLSIFGNFFNYYLAYRRWK